MHFDNGKIKYISLLHQKYSSSLIQTEHTGVMIRSMWVIFLPSVKYSCCVKLRLPVLGEVVGLMETKRSDY